MVLGSRTIEQAAGTEELQAVKSIEIFFAWIKIWIELVLFKKII